MIKPPVPFELGLLLLAPTSCGQVVALLPAIILTRLFHLRCLFVLFVEQLLFAPPSSGKVPALLPAVIETGLVHIRSPPVPLEVGLLLLSTPSSGQVAALLPAIILIG